MKDDKTPADRAKQSYKRGIGEITRAARTVGDAVKRETQKAGGLGKALDDASREVVRAATHVASAVGTGLEKLGKKAQHALEHEPSEDGAGRVRVAGGPEEEWPKTREEYEEKYGKDGANWPKTREEYIERYGRPPRKRGDDDDPGFRIATGKD